MVMGKRSDGEEGVGVLTPRRKTGGSASDLCQARLFRGGSGVLVGQRLEELGQVAQLFLVEVTGVAVPVAGVVGCQYVDQCRRFPVHPVSLRCV